VRRALLTVAVSLAFVGCDGPDRLHPPQQSDRSASSQGAVSDELVLSIPGRHGVELRMKKIPAGSFAMGSPVEEEGRDEDEGSPHEVTISKPFYMGVFEVTQAQWEAVVGTCPSMFGGNPTYPVEQVSWEDCQEFIRRLNGMGIGTFRLPTEAEWEYACRAGKQTAFSFGGDPRKLEKYANYFGTPKEGERSPMPVGSFAPNAWGLYDMHGNVWEWCSDWYSTYQATKQTDPVGPAHGVSRVERGGSWYCSPVRCRSAHRYRYSPSYRYYTLGFRLVREAR
jgi:formylglycine-generating enzyme required for sulfatase activity